ncbi:hypothetical protein EJ08DRAFT_658796 [Tothia fuscella]|uniref:Peptidase C14 caspase domain-containing protein n=1 Tax=Tothia fuscella TaxID=1048955 RepID=A0A9P4U0H8_9PEZI|nr:hypothetical protein EJ08DRAFT_658796 [Tothia fuscella]
MDLTFEPPVIIETIENLSSPVAQADAEHTRLQRLWDEHMQNRPKYRPPYQSTVVLLVSWASTELNTGPEVEELAQVFEDEYSFGVQKAYLTENKNPQSQIHEHLAVFVAKHNNPGTLLIIYYAGHGWDVRSAEDAKSQGFRLLKNTDEQSLNNKWNDIDWVVAENLLINLDADVFCIFDCCNAGSLCQRRSPYSRFEYLGACAAKQETHRPGKESFTTALIWALKDLRKQPKCSFLTSELQRKVKEAPDFPKTQEPPIGHRMEPSPDHIVIAPHDINGSVAPMPDDDGPVAYDFLDLRFQFSGPITDAIIKQTAKTMSELIAETSVRKIAADCITFLQKTSKLELSTIFAKKWLQRTRLRTRHSAYSLRQPTPGLLPATVSSESPTPEEPLTPKYTMLEDTFHTQPVEGKAKRRLEIEVMEPTPKRQRTV